MLNLSKETFKWVGNYSIFIDMDRYGEWASLNKMPIHLRVYLPNKL